MLCDKYSASLDAFWPCYEDNLRRSALTQTKHVFFVQLCNANNQLCWLKFPQCYGKLLSMAHLQIIISDEDFSA